MKTKMSKKITGCIMGLSVSLISAGSAISIAIINPGFEADGAPVDGFTMVTGWEEYPGLVDSGVEPGGNGSAHRAFVQSNELGAYQVTGHTITTGDAFTLDWFAGNAFDSTDVNSEVTLFRTTDGGATQTTIASLSYQNPGSFTARTLSYTAVAADAGAVIGIGFGGLTSNVGEKWAGYDDFALNYTPVPEPTVSFLSAIAVIGALVSRRR